MVLLSNYIISGFGDFGGAAAGTGDKRFGFDGRALGAGWSRLAGGELASSGSGLDGWEAAGSGSGLHCGP